MKKLLITLLFISDAFAGLPILDCQGNWTGGYYPDTILVQPTCTPTAPAATSPSTYEAQISSLFTGSIKAQQFSAGTSFTTYRKDSASNVANTGILAENKMDFTGGQAGASYGLYGIARGIGKVGTWGIHDIVGVYGTAYKDFNGWAAGGHFDCIDTVAGGTCVGVNVEVPKAVKGTEVVGLNIQPYTGVTNVTGIQLQFPETYKYGIVAANVSWVFGMVDGVPFGFRFNPKTQRLGFYRNIGNVPEIETGFIDMNYGAPDVQLNR